VTAAFKHGCIPIITFPKRVLIWIRKSPVIEQAKTALLAGEGPVGCVFVDEKGNIVGKGYNKTDGS
jgi:hypothetical protein